MAAKRPLVLNGPEPQQIQTGDFVDVPYGGTGATTASGARTNLGLAIGTNVQAWDADLDAVAAFASTGIAVRTASNTWAQRSLATASTGRITVTNADGAAGNPTVDLASGIITTPGTYFQNTIDTYGRVTAGVNPTTLAGFGITDALNKASPTVTSGALTLAQDPVNPLEAATKQYVDARASGLDPKGSVRALSSTNITVSAPGTTIGGVTMAVNDRFILTGQTTGSENGIYVYNGSATPATRASDANTSAQVTSGMYVFVTEGTFAKEGWILGTPDPIVLGTTSLSFTQFSGAGELTAGGGLTIGGANGNTIAVATASSTRIVINANSIDLASGVIASPGTFTKVTVDTYGRVTVGATATPSDVGAQPASTELTGLAAVSTTGIEVRTASGTYTTRSLTAPAAGITITNPDGVSGSPTFALANDLGAIEALNGTGIYVRTGTDTWAARQVTTASAARITVTNPLGTAGDITLDLASGVIASPGTYNTVTVDTYGRVTTGTNVASSTDSSSTSLTNNNGSTVNIGRVIYTDASGSFKLAIANNTTTATKYAAGFVKDVTIANGGLGNVFVSGVVSATTAQWDAVTGQSGGLTPGAVYYLSDASAGAISTTAPSTANSWIIAVGTALSSTQLESKLGATPIQL